MSVPPVTLRRVFWRCLFLQAAWNRRGMQNLGFAYAIDPALRRLYDDPGARAEALRRHLGTFNCHPYTAAAIVGTPAFAWLQASSAWTKSSPDWNRSSGFFASAFSRVRSGADAKRTRTFEARGWPEMMLCKTALASLPSKGRSPVII